jgi:hypothetical protein
MAVSQAKMNELNTDILGKIFMMVRALKCRDWIINNIGIYDPVIGNSALRQHVSECIARGNPPSDNVWRFYGAIKGDPAPAREEARRIEHPLNDERYLLRWTNAMKFARDLYIARTEYKKIIGLLR